MSRWARLVVVAASLGVLAPSGCWSPVTELVTPHVEAGGAVAATLDTSASLTTTAIADGTVEPMTIVGNSAQLVFGLIIGGDVTTGQPAKALLLAGKPVQLTIAGGSQLSVHLGGQSCVTTTATVNLTPDGQGHIDGDFSGTGDGCSTSGTLKGVPISQ